MLNFKIIFSAVLLTLLSCSAHAQFSYELLSMPGRQVAVSENHDFPKVIITVVFPAGSAQDTLPGTASLVAKLIASSTDFQDETSFSNELESMGSQLSYEVSKDSVMFRLVSQSDEETVKRSFQSIYEMLYHPNWHDKSIFERERLRSKEMLSDQLSRPAAQARQYLLSLLFGQHPYAQLSAGQPSSLSLQSLDRLKQFYYQNYRTNKMIVLISGDITAEQVKAAVHKHWHKNDKDQHAPRSILKVSPNMNARSYHSPSTYHQAHMLKGALLPGKRMITDEESAYLSVANKILGGGMNSRLFETIRGEQGLAYSVYSRVSFMQEAGVWEIGLQTKAGQISEAEDSVNQVVQDFFEKGVTEQEVLAAKEALLKRWPWYFETMADRQNWVAEELLYGKAYQSWDRYKAALESVEASDLNQYIKKRRNQKWQTVWVGGENAE